MAIGALSAQTYESKDFEDLSLTSGGWTTQIAVDTTDWYVKDFSGDKFAIMSNYNGTNNIASESWMISPSLNLSSATAPMISFETIMRYNGDAIKLMVSSDYDGTSAPSSATWTDLTSMATLDVDASAWGSWTPSGEVDLTSYMGTSVYLAFVYTGSATDGSTWEVDNILIAEAGSGPVGGTAVEKTITEIQSNVSSADISYYKDSVVTTTGIVTAIYVFNSQRKGYYIQDGVGAWTGIYVYNPSSTCVRGDSVTVTGTVNEYQEVTQISNVTNTVIGSSLNDVSPTLIATYPSSYEEYESVLVRVLNANCTATTDNFGNFQADDGSGYVKVTDALFAYTPSLGTAYNITGIMQYYLYFKLAPRDANDISVYTSVKENNAVLTNVYPNPTVNGNVTIEVKENTSLVVLDLLGNVVVFNPLTSGLNSIDVSSLAAGNYILKVGSSVQQLMVK